LAGSDTYCVDIPAGYYAWHNFESTNELGETEFVYYANYGITNLLTCKSKELGQQFPQWKILLSSEYVFGYSYSDAGYIQPMPNQTQHDIGYDNIWLDNNGASMPPSYMDVNAVWRAFIEGCAMCPAGSYCIDGIRHDCAAGKTSVGATRWTSDDVQAKKTRQDPCFVCGPGSIAEAGAPECTVCQVYPKPN
jgi:hypothetical protein